jgi:hypothetical protein
VTVFSFPKDEEMKKRWIKCIHRESFIPTKYSVVCIKHFAESSIIRVDKMTRDDGSLLEVARKIPKLIKNAVPSIFHNQPSYMTKVSRKKRKHPDERRQKLSDSDETVFQAWSRDDDIVNFDNFLLKFQEKHLFDSFYKISANVINFFKVDCESNVQSDQQETKSRVLPHLLFYRNVRRILIRHFYIIAVHSFCWLPSSQKSIINCLYKLFVIHE